MEKLECPMCGEMVESQESRDNGQWVAVYFCPTDGTFAEVI